MYYNPGGYWPGQYDGNGRNYESFYRVITIVEAVNIALQQVPGQAIKAELDMEKGLRVFEVDIITTQGVKYEVSVDVNTGRVVGVKLD